MVLDDEGDLDSDDSGDLDEYSNMLVAFYHRVHKVNRKTKWKVHM